MASNAVDTLVIFAQCSECQRGEKLKQASKRWQYAMFLSRWPNGLIPRVL